MNDPEKSFVCVQEVMLDTKVLDLFGDDESLEKEALEHTQRELEPDEQNAENDDAEKQAEIAGLLKMGSLEEVSRDDATQMSVWVLSESGGKKETTRVAMEIAYCRCSLDDRLFAATPSITSFRLCLTVASQFKWGVTISDVATAFLNATLPPEALLLKCHLSCRETACLAIEGLVRSERRSALLAGTSCGSNVVRGFRHCFRTVLFL